MSLPDEKKGVREEVLYRTIVDTIPQRVFAKDRNSVYLSCNVHYAKDLGIEPEDIVGKSDFEFYPRELAEKYRADDKKIIDSGAAEEVDEKYVKDGETFWVHTVKTPLRDPDGTIDGLIGIFWDVTAERKSQELLLVHWERFLAILDAFPEIIYVVDPVTYEVLFVNRVYADALGSIPLGKKCYQAFQGFDTPCEFCTNAIILNEKKPYTWEHYNPGIGRHYQVTDQIITWPDGREVRFELAIDITDRKKAEEVMVEALAELARSNQDLEQFAYVASHDLQEPLRMVRSFAELLQKNYLGNFDDKADRFIGHVVDGATRMQQLINDLLAYSRINTQGRAPEPIDSAAVLKDVLEWSGEAVRESSAEIESGDLPTVHADPVQLGQLFQNLVSNAIKFRGERTPRVHIDARREGNEWLFSVKDNGIGIDPEHHERIFLIFKRLHERGRFPGSGIGLAIAARIVARHGGRIWVESEPGQGSTFFFTLPVEPKGGGSNGKDD